MEKKLKTFKMSDENIKELKAIADKLGITETEAVIRAVHYFYLSLSKEDETIKSGNIVSFEEYQSLQEKFTQAVYKIGELQGQLQTLSEEKEKQLMDKDKQIQSLQDIVNKLIEQRNKKNWWQFWRKV